MGLYDSIRPPAAKKYQKKKTTFLDLPGEIRNRIYTLYFFTGAVVAFRRGPKSPFEKEKETKRDLFERNFKFCTGFDINNKPIYEEFDFDHEVKIPSLQCNTLLSKYWRMKITDTNWSTSVSTMLLVNKQIVQEFIPLLYMNTLFGFTAPKRINNFLDIIPSTSISYITKIKLLILERNSPHQVANQIWNDKYHRAWTRTCFRLRNSLPNLRSIEADVRIMVHPIQLNLDQPWAVALLEFRGMESKPKCVINLISDDTIYGQPSLPEIWLAAVDLHDAFAKGVASMIMGVERKEALKSFKGMWAGKHKQYQQILNYALHTK